MTKFAVYTEQRKSGAKSRDIIEASTPDQARKIVLARVREACGAGSVIITKVKLATDGPSEPGSQTVSDQMLRELAVAMGGRS